MQRRHRGVLVAELVLRPYAALALAAVHSVHKTIRASLFTNVSRHVLVGEKTRWHAWPQSKDNEGNQVANRHGPSACSIQHRTCRRSISLAKWLVSKRKINPVAGGGVVEQPYEEENGSRNVDERIYAVGPVQDEWVLQEPMLDGKLPEDMKPLLEMDDLKSMSASDINSAFNEGHSREGAAQLVYLEHG